MTCSVLWKPVNTDGKYVGSGRFREILDKKYGFPAKLTNSDIQYLEGVRDCGYDEVQVLIDAIYENIEIEIFLEC